MSPSSDGFVTGEQSPEFRGGSVWKLERCGARDVLKMIVLSEKTLMVATHFVGRSSKPCRAVDCEGCKRRLETRWNGYLAIILLPNKVKCLVEYTEGSQPPLLEAQHRFGSIRGVQLVMSRPRKRDNAPMLLQVSGRLENTFELPDQPDVFSEMCRVWRINDDVVVPVEKGRRSLMLQAEKEQAERLKRSTFRRGGVQLTDEEKLMAAVGREKVDAHPLKDVLDANFKQNGKH
jgi:hypothetical protein